VEQAAAEAPAAAPAPSTTDLDYWRAKVRQVAEAEARPDAGSGAQAVLAGSADKLVNRSRPRGVDMACDADAEVAWRHFSESVVATAEAEARALLRRSPDCAPGHVVLGRIYYQRGDFKAALAEWEAARKLAPMQFQGLDALIAQAKKEMGVEGELGRKESSHFQVSFDGRDDQEVARKAVEILEEARGVVGRALDYFPQDAVPVILYPRETFRDTVGPPAWADGLYDGKIRLASAGALSRPDRFKAVLFHEYTHAVVHRLAAGSRVPTWVNEGLAQYAESLAGARPSQVRLTRYIPLPSLHGSFTGMDERTAEVAYEESRLAVAELISRHRAYRVKELLERLGKGRSFETAFEDTYVFSYESYVKGFKP
jgi:tetratricopeptide (TPR) repeat protein